MEPDKPMESNDLVVARPEGLYCPPGDFYIDPWRPVARAVITHAHADHARFGHGRYLCAEPGRGVLLARLPGIALGTLPYGEAITHHGVRLSLHPAGHVLGSAQVRLEHGGRVWVASGDYKVEDDGTCAPFEPVRCDTFITESTFGLPIYRWPSQAALMAEIFAWWQLNAAAGRASVLYAYAFGKAQRILSGLARHAGAALALPGPIVVHGALHALNQAYRDAGVTLPPVQAAGELPARSPLLRRALVLAPPSAQRSTWLRRFGEASDAFASGWMQLRGTRRRRGVDRGFALSDHADWPGLLSAISATGAERVIVTHGNVPVMVRYLSEQGWRAQAFDTEYGDEADEGESRQGPAEADGTKAEHDAATGGDAAAGARVHLADPRADAPSAREIAP